MGGGMLGFGLCLLRFSWGRRPSRSSSTSRRHVMLRQGLPIRDGHAAIRAVADEGGGVAEGDEAADTDVRPSRGKRQQKMRTNPLRPSKTRRARSNAANGATGEERSMMLQETEFSSETLVGNPWGEIGGSP